MVTRDLHAVLLAAGEGSRLRPLTNRVPKPLLPIDGTAVIDTLLGQLDGLGVARVTVVVGYHGDLLSAHLMREHAHRFDLDIVTQPDRHGTGHALQCALQAGLPRSAAIVAATDTRWHDADVARLVRQAISGDALVTMALRRWPIEQLPHRSCVATDDDLRVQRVLEKPHVDDAAGYADDGATALSGSPLYVFDAGFWRYVERLAPGPSGMTELAAALQHAIDDGHVVQGVEVHETRDITRPDDLLRFNFPYLARLLD